MKEDSEKGERHVARCVLGIAVVLFAFGALAVYPLQDRIAIWMIAMAILLQQAIRIIDD